MNVAGVLVLTAVLAAIGMMGVLARRNVLVMMMGVELMLTAANILMVAAGVVHGLLDAQLLVFFVMMVAAAEVAVGLGLLVLLFRFRQTISTKGLTWLKG